MKHRPSSGFTILELLIVTAIIAIVASLAVPKFLAAKISANECSAIATLRAILQAQTQAQTSTSIDTDADGCPEYGYFGELAGTVPARVSALGAPAAGGPGDELVPSPLLTSLGAVVNGVLSDSGYIFRIWLPAPTAAGLVAAIPEDMNGGKAAAPFPDPDNGEVMWCAYAWPIKARQTGTPALFINQAGDMLKTPNRGGLVYEALAGGPNFDAAFTVAGHMGSPVASPGGLGVDGNLWVPVSK